MTNTVNVKKTKKRKKVASLESKKARAGWIFVLPFVIGFLLIYFPILFESLRSTLYYGGGNAPEQFNFFTSYYEAFFNANTAQFKEILFTGLSIFFQNFL